MVAMAGGSPRHALVISNVTIAIGKRLPVGCGCRAFNGDLRTSVHWDRLITYPDFQVVCGELQYTDDREDTITNPTFVVEVLSPSTERHDRGKKLEYYRNCPSIKEYLLIDANPVDIEHGWRVANGGWNSETIREREATIRLDSIHVELPVSDIYRDAELVRGS